MKLKTIEDTDRLNYRFPVSLKQELDQLAERCKKEKLDFIAALSEGMRGVAKSIRQELDGKRSQRGARNVPERTCERSGVSAITITAENCRHRTAG